MAMQCEEPVTVCYSDSGELRRSLYLVVSQPPVRSSGLSYLDQAALNPTCCCDR